MSSHSLPVAPLSDRPVSSQRLAAVLMVICEAAVVAQPSRGWFFALGLMSLALISILLASRRWFVEIPLFWQVVGITSIFAFKYSLLPHAFPLDASYINSELSHEIANGLIAVQICALCHARFAEKLPSTFIVLGGIAVVFGSNARVHSVQREISLALTVLFLFSVGLVAMTSRRKTIRSPFGPRHMILAGVIVSFAVTAGAGAHLLRRYERDLESIVLQYLAGSEGDRSRRSGFSGVGTLSQIGDWKTNDENRIRVRVSSATAPGYLRGRVWDTYTPIAGRWTTSVTAYPVGVGAPINAHRPPFAGNFFRLQETSAADWRTMEFRLDNENHAATFLPLEAAFVYINESSISVDDHGTIHRPKATTAPYAAFLPVESPRRDLAPDLREAGLSLDPEVDSRIIAVAEELFTGTTTTRSKINAVVTHLTRNFQYKLGISIPDNEDPLAYFLSQRPPAHCEYFATAAAVLLKLGGVPARYVTGYVAAERNELAGVWIARSRDAHAWVEAYDEDEQRWQVVEATPSAGVPEHRASAASDEFMGGIWQALLELKDIFQDQGLLAVLQHLLMLPAVQVLLLGGAVIWWLQRRSDSGPLAVAAEEGGRDLREWHRLLAKMDAAMVRIGLPRGVDETLTDFAERLRRSTDSAHQNELAEWYRTYAEARYSSELAAPPADLAALPNLRHLSRAKAPS